VTNEELAEQLTSGARELGLDPTAEQIGQLLQFLALLRRWGKVYNLTAIDRPEDIVRLHLLDSLSLWPHLRGSRVLDVGTGAGLPGIPLAVLFPERQFVLLDRTAKKVRFVLQAAIALGLRNVAGEHSRIEDYAPPQPFDAIVARAYASLTDIWSQTARLLAADGAILAMKGRAREIEQETVPAAQLETVELFVPGLDAERHLVVMTESGASRRP
jgi:16S rRNA (guanine527-N7)-methyltransferase